MLCISIFNSKYFYLLEITKNNKYLGIEIASDYWAYFLEFHKASSAQDLYTEFSHSFSKKTEFSLFLTKKKKKNSLSLSLSLSLSEQTEQTETQWEKSHRPPKTPLTWLSRWKYQMTMVCSCSIAVLLIVTTLLCFSSLSLFCFRYLEEQWFWVVFLWSSLRILFVKFLGLVGLYRGIRLVFFWLFKGVSWGFLWLVFVVVFLFQKILWEFFSVDFLWHLAKNFKSCVLFAMRF